MKLSQLVRGYSKAAHGRKDLLLALFFAALVHLVERGRYMTCVRLLDAMLLDDTYNKPSKYEQRYWLESARKAIERYV